MSKQKINLERFLREKRLTLPELAAEIDVPYKTLYRNTRIGIAKNNVIRKIEAAYGSVSEYIVEEKETAA